MENAAFFLSLDFITIKELYKSLHPPSRSRFIFRPQECPPDIPEDEREDSPVENPLGMVKLKMKRLKGSRRHASTGG
jgi:hypothetical protein